MHYCLCTGMCTSFRQLVNLKYYFSSQFKTLKMESNEILKWSIIAGSILFCLLFYKFILRVFFGMVIVPEDKIGLVTKKFVLFGKQQLPEGHIIAIDGEAG